MKLDNYKPLPAKEIKKVFSSLGDDFLERLALCCEPICPKCGSALMPGLGDDGMFMCRDMGHWVGDFTMVKWRRLSDGFVYEQYKKPICNSCEEKIGIERFKNDMRYGIYCDDCWKRINILNEVNVVEASPSP